MDEIATEITRIILKFLYLIGANSIGDTFCYYNRGGINPAMGYGIMVGVAYLVVSGLLAISKK
jgi:hypothetical protein